MTSPDSYSSPQLGKKDRARASQQALAVPVEPVPVSPLPGFDPSRILFLDMDGVVLHGQGLWATRNNRHIPPEKIALVREVCARTGCLVVVSSTWRYSDETADLLRFHGIPLHRDWRTGVANDMAGSLIIGTQRGVEIGRWVARHPVTAFAIIDDDSDMLPEQLPHFVQTKFECGIERHHVEALVGILTRDSDGNRNGEDPQGLSAKHDSALAQPIAQSPSS